MLKTLFGRGYALRHTESSTLFDQLRRPRVRCCRPFVVEQTASVRPIIDVAANLQDSTQNSFPSELLELLLRPILLTSYSISDADAFEMDK